MKKFVTLIKILLYVFKGQKLRDILGLVNLYGSGNYILIKQFRKTDTGWQHIPTGNLFKDDALNLVQFNLEWWVFLIENFDFKFENNHYRVRTKRNDRTQIVSLVFDAGHLVAFKEIFFDGVYNFLTPSKTVILDIGSNIGQASLFFATNPNVEKIFGYEMMPTTHIHALQNLELNPLFQEKIELKNYALGKNEEEFNYTQNSQSSVLQNLKELKESESSNETTTLIRVKTIDSVVDKILSDYPSHSLIVKMDCEGSEYELVPTLFETKQLKKISGLLLEWHGQNPEIITEFLMQAGFLSINLFMPVHGHPLGMIYAVNVMKSS